MTSDEVLARQNTRKLVRPYLQLVDWKPRSRKANEKYAEMRKQIASMEPWFLPWLQIMAIPSINPTARLRTQKEIDACHKHGFL